MVQHWLLFLIFCLSLPALGQDERYYRQILTGELPKLFEGMKENQGHQFNVAGSRYHVDLNGDGMEETIRPQKRDGVDWIEIRDHSERILFEAKLFATGAESHLYKLKLVTIAPGVKVLILFLDEGFTAGREFESTAKLYVISWEKDDFASMRMSEGPHFYHEKQSIRDQYFRRNYLVDVLDVNNDGVKEILVHFNHIQRLMEYKGNGEWKRL